MNILISGVPLDPMTSPTEYEYIPPLYDVTSPLQSTTLHSECPHIAFIQVAPCFTLGSALVLACITVCNFKQLVCTSACRGIVHYVSSAIV